MNPPEKEQEKKKTFGRYVVQEHTARRLVVEGRRRPLLTVAIVWGIFIPIAALIGPWRGETRLLITLTTGGVLLLVSLLILRFIPHREQLTVNMEEGRFRAERRYRFPGARWTREVDLQSVEGIRPRRRIWRDRPDSQATRWAVELVEKEGQPWRITEGKTEAPIQEIARLTAEVSGRPLLDSSPALET